jgi:hypothetical protein
LDLFLQALNIQFSLCTQSYRFGQGGLQQGIIEPSHYSSRSNIVTFIKRQFNYPTSLLTMNMNRTGRFQCASQSLLKTDVLPFYQDDLNGM